MPPKAANATPSKKEQQQLDSVYQYDEAYVDLMREEKPWAKNVKHFRKCRISALAAMKMLKHALRGVDKGRRAGTNPLEVMGLMIGKPEGDTIIVMDVTPLPVEGTETKVIADDVGPYMFKLQDSMELRRKDNFVGWYHSHPFDVETYSHCHLSSTDVQTQFGWQSQSPFWTAIVVDPLRSLARQEPEFGAFRCFPVDHNPPPGVCPDGSRNSDDKAVTQRWGLTHQRYYAMEISYFMSSLGSNLLNVMSRNSLWIRVLSSSSVMEEENRARFSDRVTNATSKVDSASARMPTQMRYAAAGGAPKKGTEELQQAMQASSDLALEQVKGHIAQISKNYLFNKSVAGPGLAAPSASGAGATEQKQD